MNIKTQLHIIFSFLVSSCFLAATSLPSSDSSHVDLQTFIKWQTGWNQDQVPHMWDLILAPACLPPALYFIHGQDDPNITTYDLVEIKENIAEILYSMHCLLIARVVKKDWSSSLKLNSRSRHPERHRREPSAEGTRGGSVREGVSPSRWWGYDLPRKIFEIYIAGGGFCGIF